MVEWECPTNPREASGLDPEAVHVSNSIHLHGEQLFRTYEASSGPEWVDSIIVAYMQSEDIEYIYSFDDDFDVFSHVTRLTSATNPFKPE